MKTRRMQYAGLANMFPSLGYGQQYTSSSVMPSKIIPYKVPGIDNRRPEVYPRAERIGIEKRGILTADA